MEKKFSVYVITCLVNNKKYVGLTCQRVENRISNGRKYGGRLREAVELYGWDLFSYEVVGNNLTLEEAQAMEISLIRSLKTKNEKFGYNTTFGGECRLLGHKQTSETKQKIKESMMGFKRSKENRERLSVAKSGVKHHAAKKVYQFEKDGTYIRSWDYMSAAAEALNIAKTSISAACLGKRPSAGGYRWSYSMGGDKQC